LEAPAGEVVTVQLSETVPVNELPGVTVMVEEPLAAPVPLVMAALLVRVKLFALLALGACQKSPQPTIRGAAASNSLAHLPILIAAPSFLAELNPPLCLSKPIC
jgi:hypothetical protein